MPNPRLLTDEEMGKVIQKHWIDNSVTGSFQSAHKKVIQAQDDKTVKWIIGRVEKQSWKSKHPLTDTRIPEDGYWHLTDGRVMYEDEWQAPKKELRVE